MGLEYPALVPQEKVIFWPYNKFFIDQACSVKINVCLISFLFLRFYWPRRNAEKKTEELGQYTAILTSKTHVYFDLTDDFWTKDQA